MNALITHDNCQGAIIFPIARTSVTQNNCFRILCAVIQELSVSAIFFSKVSPVEKMGGGGVLQYK